MRVAKRRLLGSYYIFSKTMELNIPVFSQRATVNYYNVTKQVKLIKIKKDTNHEKKAN